MQNSELSSFAVSFLFITLGLAFLLVTLGVASLIRPHRPNEEKLSAYECGEEPLSNAWGYFNIRYYVLALVFILFDVELVFLFPWATVFGKQALLDATQGRWGWFALAEMAVFVGILALGLAYAWAKGFLEWAKPQPQQSAYRSPVPASMYQHLKKNLTKDGSK
jgi:NADH-quinone oxidoreductase subunit A